MEYVLQTHHLQKRYGRFEALRGLTMNVPKGAIYGLVGKNGAGKTTLIRLICGLQQPSEGTFQLFGVPNEARDLPKIRRRMGAVVETPAIYPDRTAAENLELQCDILGQGYDNVPQLLELVGLSGTGKKKAGKFSLGMRQRLGIALALCGGGEFLILDEPTNGLDPQGIVDMRNLILKLNQERGITFLISSHILDELSKIAAHYGFVADGKMVKEITAEELSLSCRKSIHIVTDGKGDLCAALDKLQYEYRLYSETQANIYGEYTVTGLVLALHAQGICVESLSENQDNLEQYYFSVIGGDDRG
ncbi:MAG: ATP-binding cassette domain-containing protein [Ruminococcaceae bacterium]|nr:ATP-binding cassette domain-containing protein [Oscillospiraceae bacterium]